MGVFAYAATMLVLSSLIDEPSWFAVCHVAVVLIALGVVHGTLQDIATRSDWTDAQRVSWRNWLWSFNLFAAAAYYWLHMRSR
ncbi:hypothetical protein C8N24_6400 [Solirubrobacter pauli]|uniref:Uncharacterized protein n=2 Tax=Solirubrobacter pauli TaxID=166793 RepID=A0A660L4L7_9ACTN|nr:hypothetical protein C8N24_6400 [Solirubrobacter pauli]